MKDSEIWEQFNKYKTTHKKEQVLKNLYVSDDPKSLERLCQTLLSNRSPTIKELLLKIGEVLENRFETEPELINYEYYQKFKQKEKIQSFKNYWYEKSKKIKREEIFETFSSEIGKRYAKSKPGKFTLKYRFDFTKHLTGSLFLTIGRGTKSEYEFSFLGYGYNSDLRDYQNSSINNLPNCQIHVSQNSKIKYKILSNNDGVFTFHENLKSELEQFYNFHEHHYENLSKIKPDQFENSEYLNIGKEKSYFSKSHWVILSLINVHLNENNLDYVSEFAKMGLEMKLGKSAWNDYLNKFV